MYLKFLKIVPNLDSMLSILHSWMAAAWGPLKLSCISGCYIEFSQVWRSSLGGWKHDVGGLGKSQLAQGWGLPEPAGRMGCGTTRMARLGDSGCLLLLLALCPGHLSPNPNSDPAISCDCQAAAEGSSLAARGNTLKRD